MGKAVMGGGAEMPEEGCPGEINRPAAEDSTAWLRYSL